MSLIEEAACAAIAKLWALILNKGRDVEELELSSNFFRLGGTSLLAMRFMIEAEALFGRELPLNLLVDHPTLESVAREIVALDISARSGESLLEEGEI